MPDPFRNEETETRTLSLCLYGFTGITNLNRCAYCPGAARTALNHRRCPLDATQPNIFHPLAAESKSSADINKWSASSSALHEKSSHDEAVTVLSETLAALSLGDDEPVAGCSHSDPAIRRPHDDVGMTQLDADREAKKTDFRGLSVQKWLQEKPQRLFQDLGTENLWMRGCRRIPRDDMQRLMRNSGVSSSAALSMMDTQPVGHPSGKPASFIPGCILSMETDGCGVLPCNDGIEIEGCGDEMDIEEL